MEAIKISDKHSIEYKNGYWIYHIHAVSEKGAEYKSKTQTFAKMLDMHHNAKLNGLCGEDIMKAVEQLIGEMQKAAGRYVLKERKPKEQTKCQK